MKKYLFTLILAIVGTMAAMAQYSQTSVIVEFKSGETIAMALNEQPKAKFEQQELVLTSTKFEGRYNMADIKRFYFDDLETAIKTINAEKTITNGSIYDLNGRQVSTFEGAIDSTTLPAGVYIIKTDGGKSFKVTKK